MYRCEFCDKTVGLREHQLKVITKTRPRSYFTVIEKENKKTHKKSKYTKHSKGWEIVEEKNGCKECVELFKKER